MALTNVAPPISNPRSRDLAISRDVAGVAGFYPSCIQTGFRAEGFAECGKPQSNIGIEFAWHVFRAYNVEVTVQVRVTIAQRPGAGHGT